jgi:hypothetical protein
MAKTFARQIRFRVRLAGAAGVLAMSAVGPTAQASMPPAVYQLGHPAAAGEFAVTASSVTQHPFTGDCEGPGACVLLVVDCEVRNISPKPVPISALPQLRLIDPNGQVADPLTDVTLSGEARAPAGASLAPNEGRHVTVSFHVPAKSFDRATWLLLVGGAYGPRIALK